jgi:hypothetical protein
MKKFSLLERRLEMLEQQIEDILVSVIQIASKGVRL